MTAEPADRTANSFAHVNRRRLRLRMPGKERRVGRGLRTRGARVRRVEHSIAFASALASCVAACGDPETGGGNVPAGGSSLGPTNVPVPSGGVPEFAPDAALPMNGRGSVLTGTPAPGYPCNTVGDRHEGVPRMVRCGCTSTGHFDCIGVPTATVPVCSKEIRIGDDSLCAHGARQDIAPGCLMADPRGGTASCECNTARVWECR